MTNNRLWIGALLLGGVIMGSCSQEQEADLPEEGEGMRLTIGIGNGDTCTRSYFEQSDTKWDFKFENKDQLCVTNQFTGPSGYVFTRQYSNDFYCQTATPTASASDWFAFYPLFTVAGAGTVVYPPGYEGEDPDNEYSGGYMDLTRQAGTREKIAQYYVMSGKMEKAVPGTSRLHFDMKPAVAILHIGNYDGAKNLMVKLDKDTYWDGRLYVVDYTSNCNYVVGETVYETTILYMRGNGEYYVAVPAGRKLYLTDEYGNNLKTTKDGGLEAGKYYDVNCTPEQTTHALQVDVENDRITGLLQSSGLRDWNEGDEVRFCNTQGGDFIYRYQTGVFLAADARAASSRASWLCTYPLGASNGSGSTMTYDMSGQSGRMADFAAHYHLMTCQVDNVAGGNIPSKVTVGSQTALLTVENPGGSKILAVKFADGSYWDGTLSMALAPFGTWQLLAGHSVTPVTICQVTSAGTYHLSVPAMEARLADATGKELSESISFAKGNRYTVTLAKEEEGGEGEITGEDDFSLYLSSAEYDETLRMSGHYGWKSGTKARLYNPDTEYVLTCKDGEAFVSDKRIGALSRKSSWFALYPTGIPSGAGSWLMDFASQSGTLQDFASKYNLMCCLLPDVATMNVPLWATMQSRIAMLEVQNNARWSRSLVLRRTDDGRCWNGLIEVLYDSQGETINPSYSGNRTVICTVPARSTAYIAIPQGVFSLVDEYGNELSAGNTVNVLYGQKKSVMIF